MKSILIVEDNPGIISFLKQGLEEEDYIIYIANNGLEGLNLFQKNNIDLILLDWMMPKMTGIAFCEKIRLIDSNIPIIFLTAKDTTDEVIVGLKAGANDYIKKPFSFEELLERIKIHFRNKSKIEKFCNGSLIINFEKREVFENNNLINLTKKEYDLLVYLVKNKDKVSTREEIIQKVWDIHFQYDSSVIDVFINAIRKKIPTINSFKMIKPVRGVGYIFSEN